VIDLFDKPTTEVAKALLGSYLIHESCEGTTIGKIVETEAYLADDPASHSFVGKTPRNAMMFGSAGKAYIYLNYGMHNCFNVVTAKEGIGEAVLIRALEPIKGIKLMQKRRKTEKVTDLCSGPGKLSKAMGITLKNNGADLINSNLRIILSDNSNHKIVKTTRVGITKGSKRLLRFYIKDNSFISKK